MKKFTVELETKLTRTTTREYFEQRLGLGCPHCRQPLGYVIKGKGIKPVQSRENFAGVFARCNNSDCSFTNSDGRYYYVGHKAERVDEFLPIIVTTMAATVKYCPTERADMAYCTDCEPKGRKICTMRSPHGKYDSELFCYSCHTTVGFHNPSDF